MVRSFQIIIREFRRSLLKLLHIHGFCKQGVVAAYQHISIVCYVAAYDAHLANYTLQQIPTT